MDWARLSIARWTPGDSMSRSTRAWWRVLCPVGRRARILHSCPSIALATPWEPRNCSSGHRVVPIGPVLIGTDQRQQRGEIARRPAQGHVRNTTSSIRRLNLPCRDRARTGAGSDAKSASSRPAPGTADRYRAVAQSVVVSGKSASGDRWRTLVRGPAAGLRALERHSAPDTDVAIEFCVPTRRHQATVAGTGRSTPPVA